MNKFDPSGPSVCFPAGLWATGKEKREKRGGSHTYCIKTYYQQWHYIFFSRFRCNNNNNDMTITDSKNIKGANFKISINMNNSNANY